MSIFWYSFVIHSHYSHSQHCLSPNVLNVLFAGLKGQKRQKSPLFALFLQERRLWHWHSLGNRNYHVLSSGEGSQGSLKLSKKKAGKNRHATCPSTTGADSTFVARNEPTFRSNCSSCAMYTTRSSHIIRPRQPTRTAILRTASSFFFSFLTLRRIIARNNERTRFPAYFGHVPPICSLLDSNQWWKEPRSGEKKVLFCVLFCLFAGIMCYFLC